MDKRTRLIGGGMALLGVASAVAILFADALGFGDAPGIGWQQRLVALGGAMVAVIGLVVALRPNLPASLTSRETRGRLALASGSLVFGVLMAEFALRVIRPPSVSFDHQPTIYEPDPVLGFRYVPDSRDRLERLEFREPVRANNAGFIDDDFVDEAGVTRIAAIGDSFTAGMQVGRGRSYPDVLERDLDRLEATSCPCEVLNFGVDGTGTVQQAVILEEMALAYEPDVVIVAYFDLDILDVAYGTIYRDMHRDYVLYYRDEAERDALAREVDDLLDGGGGALRGLLRRSYIARALYNSWLDRHDNPEPNLRINKHKPDDLQSVMPLDEAEALVMESVLGMAESCEEAGCELVFVVIPTKEEVTGRAELAYLPILEAVEAEGVRTLSLLEPLRERRADGERLYWRYDSHFNRAGYRVMAEEILEYLLAENLV